MRLIVIIDLVVIIIGFASAHAQTDSVAYVAPGDSVVEENSYDAWGRMRDPSGELIFFDDFIVGFFNGLFNGGESI